MEIVENEHYAIIHGDSIEALADVGDETVDSMVTDPPAGVALMGKSWDCFRRAHNPADVGRETVGGRLSRTAPASYTESERDNFVATLTPIFAECYRVMKPGAWGTVWALPRTSSWTARALEDAGFEIRDCCSHHFGSGFPKSMDIAKAIQKHKGIEPVGEKPPSLGYANDPQWNDLQRQLIMPDPSEDPDAAKWVGYGTALKPGREDWLLVQKPFKGTYAANVLKHGVGGINIDGCRIGDNAGWAYPNGRGGEGCFGSDVAPGLQSNLDIPMAATKGRFPSNVLLSHSELCSRVGTTRVKSGTAFRENGGGKNCHTEQEKPAMENMSYASADGTEPLDLWACVPDCPVRILDTQSGKLKSGKGAVKRKSGKGKGSKSESIGAESRPDGTPMLCYGDQGYASRFYKIFYAPKAPKAEKEAGCDGLVPKTAAELTGRKEGSDGLMMKNADGTDDRPNPYAGTSGAQPRKNHHPTIKNLALMRYLCRMVTPPNGLVLDPFAGSASTGVAALQEGFRFLGVEKEADYYEICKARLAHALNSLPVD